MVQLDDRFQIDPSIVSRQIGDEYILVPIRQNVGDLESIFTLNETAARAWALMDGVQPLRAVRDLIVTEFEVGADEAGSDLLELVEQLQEIGALRRV